MLKNMRFYVGLLAMALSVAILLLPSCSSDESQQSDSLEVAIRLAREPDVLNPVRYRISQATQICGLIAPAMAEYDPYDLQLKPFLLKDLGTTEEIKDGEYAGGEIYTYEIRGEAVWDNGEPITGYDYEFTLKAVMNPEVDAPIWKSFLSFIEAVEVDPANPRKFKVTVAEPYMLAQAITCNFNILPRYFYDPDGLLDTFTLEELKGMNEETALTPDEALVEFARLFSSPEINRDTAVGAGPYRFVEWVSNQHIILERKQDWWGDKINDVPNLFNAFPSRIIYQIIPDETAAISALKDGSCDLAEALSASAFSQMKADSQWQDQFDFYSPVIFQVRYLELNNRHELLREKAVRQALAHAMDYDAMIENIELGEGVRTVGPFSTSRDYYNTDLELIDYDLEEAKQILTEAGWVDSDNDGTVDKEVNGERKELELEILTTQSPMGQQVALLLKEGAAQVGIDIEIVTKDAASWRQAMDQRDFEILPMQVRSSPAPNDPYQGWHSDSDQPGGDNRSGFRNAEADSLIELIRSAESAEERKQQYLELQEVIYEEQPVIFLYVPVERIIVNSRLQMTPSSRRPGYFVNLIRAAGT